MQDADPQARRQGRAHLPPRRPPGARLVLRRRQLRRPRGRRRRRRRRAARLLRRCRMLASKCEFTATILGSMAAACECETDGNIPISREDVHRQARRGRARRRSSISGSDARHRRRARRPGPQAPALRGHRLRRHPSTPSIPRPTSAICARLPLDAFDAALLCIPDAPKIGLLGYLLEHGKHVLVEKPLVADDEAALARLAAGRARAKASCCYTAYNHRFEPHFVRMRDLVASGALGRIYRCRMFYGNGTARLVRNSRLARPGRRRAARSRLASARYRAVLVRRHRRAISRSYRPTASRTARPITSCSRSRRAAPQLEFEMTLLSWRNHFTCDVFAENGTRAYQLAVQVGTVRRSPTARACCRAAGRRSRSVTLVQDDPTWALEYEHFKTLCRERRADRSVERHLAQSRAAPARRRSRQRWRARHDSPSSATPG